MAKVNFIRRHTDVEVDEEPIVDGNFIVTGDGGVFIDYGTERIAIGGSIIVDSTMSDTSTNPVQNKVVKEYTDGKFKTINTKSDTDTYSCNYINNVMQNNILGVSLTANVDPQISTYVEINTWKQQLKIGDKLNVENGKIKIGAGVNYIKIYGQLGINSDGDALFYMWLKKNGNNVGVWEVNRTFNTYVIIPINQILQVEEGDIISMATYQNAKYTIEVEKTEVYFEAIYQ